MSIADQIKNLFSKKVPESEMDSRLSLAMPDQGAGAEPPETVLVVRPVQASRPAPLAAHAPAEEVPDPDATWIAVPGLGARPAAQQLRILGVLLGLSLLLLAGVTVYALSQSERVAQQLIATSRSLSQAQGLGRASNLALGGSVPAFAALGDSAELLARTTASLQSEDSSLQPELQKIAPLVEKLRGSARAIVQQQKNLTLLAKPDAEPGAAPADSAAGLDAARKAQAAIAADGDALRVSLEALQMQLGAQAGVGGNTVALLALAAALALMSAAGLAYVQLQDSRRRQAGADAQRQEAERQEQDAKRVNDANQAAILRLMNELQTVAEGDLTQEATVTEDITGAIADSVNYTVEELRSLVANVQNTASQVAQTTSDVDATSTELLAASKEQLHEIHQTGQSVLEMAGRINDVSSQAQESARVARQSLLAAESGFKAVQNAIGGMNAIREQIQETSKRIKRLGESSQEIGEITELISDITEQTNVLALNAAIQAASAGEAGRGFSVVAEEVQRLAERSGDATRQIAALVKAIQTDTQDAIGAMERSTQGVVEGAKLSDNAGTALTEIDKVSRRVADLIEQISNSASREAGLANEMAQDIQHIFAVTEQTGEGTRVTAGQVRELSRMAEELRQSVSRFKIV